MACASSNSSGTAVITCRRPKHLFVPGGQASVPALTRIRLETHTLQQAVAAGISVPLAVSVALCPAAHRTPATNNPIPFGAAIAITRMDLGAVVIRLNVRQIMYLSDKYLICLTYGEAGCCEC
jgi:hypothetical protein